MRRLAAEWARFKSHQICHQHGTSAGGDDVWCAGFYETQIPDDLKRSFEEAGFIVKLEA